MDALGLFALVSIGGDGSLSIAQQMFEYGIPIVGVPKTIDNDLTGSRIGAIKISDAIGKTRAVRPDGNLVRTVRALGICFGD